MADLKIDILNTDIFAEMIELLGFAFRSANDETKKEIQKRLHEVESKHGSFTKIEE